MARQQCAGVSRNFLCHFLQEQPDFRIQELESLASLIGSQVNYDAASYSNKNPYLLVQLPSEDVAKKIAKRSFLLRSILELWGWGRNYEELKTSILKNMSEAAMEPYTKTDYTFRLRVFSYNKKCSAERQQKIFKNMSYLPINGKVDLNNAQHQFSILEDYGNVAEEVPEEPVRVFFGRDVGSGCRNLINHFTIKDRWFIGNTTMDPHLAFLMANQAKVKESDLILDPFAGSGGILLPCAYFGGHVLGADIDWNIVHGKGVTSRANVAKERGEDENVRANLRQYGLESRYVDMMVADAAQYPWKEQEVFDAIVTDPPYGIREGSRKIGSKSKPKPIPQECLDHHYPEQKSYKMSELFVDLVKFAARYLVVGGRLVYLIPVVKMDLPALPSHPCLHQVACSLQPLHGHVGRQLITMEKQLSWKQYMNTKAHEEEVVHAEREKMAAYDNFRERYLNED